MLEKISNKEWKLILSLTGLAFIFSSREFILFIQGQGNIVGLALWYAITFIYTYILLKGLGIRIGPLQIGRWSLQEECGLMMLMYAYFLTFNWNESCWADIAVNGSCTLPQIITATEDGILWSTLSPFISNPELLRLIVYPGAVLALTLGSALLLTRRIHL